ncbi:DUF1737 domain-containing protein [Pelobacter propionicus]|uniref:DUF1737 domain-containing protein n=1 Tax=Pelobacter propionicus TaxID=29543 RepID=UPI0002EA2B0D|nr:DUF1737 domain-containing protein [Pelobacter propionicus]
MITEYSVVSENDVTALKARVNEALSQGWQPYEGLQVSTPIINGAVAPLYTQVLVKIIPSPQLEEEFLVK